MNIRNHLDGWEETDQTFRGRPVWARSEALLVEIEGPAVHDEALDADLRHTGLPIRDVWFLSRHRAASGRPSLTVHPIGNHGQADVGGEPRTLSPSAPHDMAALLRRLKVRQGEAELPHAVTYEATHHGPRMRMPSLFVEIGSDPKWYNDPAGGKAVAAAIGDVLAQGGRSEHVLVGVGGGHYVPRMTQMAMEGTAAFGHFLPSHAVDPEAGPQALQRCIDATPGCDGVYIHKKGLKGTQRQAVGRWMEDLGLDPWSRP